MLYPPDYAVQEQEEKVCRLEAKRKMLGPDVLKSLGAWSSSQVHLILACGILISRDQASMNQGYLRNSSETEPMECVPMHVR